MKKTASGFSLTELMITLAIIGILISIAIPMYSNMTSSGAARAHAANFDAAVAFLGPECTKNLMNPNNPADVYTQLNGGPAGFETKFAPNTNNPAFTFNNAGGVGAGQVDITGLTQNGGAWECDAAASAAGVTVTSGGIANGATAADYPNGNPAGRTRTVP